jgi:hypothetical protein
LVHINDGPYSFFFQPWLHMWLMPGKWLLIMDISLQIMKYTQRHTFLHESKTKQSKASIPKPIWIGAFFISWKFGSCLLKQTLGSLLQPKISIPFWIRLHRSLISTNSLLFLCCLNKLLFTSYILVAL